eukprot:1981082-Amphidinium_carterae.1
MYLRPWDWGGVGVGPRFPKAELTIQLVWTHLCAKPLFLSLKAAIEQEAKPALRHEMQATTKIKRHTQLRQD